jgi:ligand-binding sensor domain-containing protein/signal transduction histidine kinase
MKKIGAALLIVICLNGILWPGNTTVEFKRISVEQGLSQNTTMCILQDHEGFMWIGTEDGLNKYDGYTFKTYYQDLDNPYSLSHNRIRVIYEDRSRTLWIGTMGGGLNKFIREEEKFLHYTADPTDPHSLSENTVLSIYEDRSGNFWIGTYNGLNKFDREKEKFTHYPLVNSDTNDSHLVVGNWVMSIFEDSRGQLWIGTSRGLNLFDRIKGQCTRYQSTPGAPGAPGHGPVTINTNNITSICEDRSGMLWIGTFGGIKLFDPGEKKFIPFKDLHANPGTVETVFYDRIECMLKDRVDCCWIGTIKGLFKYDPETNKFKHFQHQPSIPRSSSSNLVMSIFEDQSSVMWIGTYHGLYKFDNKKKKFVHYKLPGNDSEENNNIFSIYEDSMGTLWLGTIKGGLVRFNKENGTITAYRTNPSDPYSISDNTVSAMLENRHGEFWVGTEKGLNRFDFPTKKFYRYIPDPHDPFSLSNGYIKSLCEDTAGRLWIGTQNGLNMFERKSRKFFVYKNEPGNPNSLSNNDIEGIYEERPGILFIGTYGGGLNRYDIEKNRFVHYRHDPGDSRSLSNNKIYTILEDRSGVPWIGTNSGGLDKFDKKTETFTRYTRKNGLPSNVIFGILEDNLGNLWLSTNRGVSKFDPKTEEFRNYTMDDGLQSYEFYPHAYYKSRDGEMFFGGSNGFNGFYPENVKNNPHIPRIVITSFLKLNEEVKLEKPVSEIKQLELSYNDRLFSFKFAALEYTAPERNKYAYRLEGFKDEWIQLDEKHEITFTRLPPGDYVLWVKGSNSDGVWNEEGTSIAILIRPPFYRSVWFMVMGGILLVAVLAFFYRVRTNNLKQNLERERLKKELKLKADFTAMLVHDLRNPLTAVIGYSAMLREYSDKMDISKTGKVIARTSEKMLILINDMLDISKFEAGKMTLNKKKAALFDVVTDIIEIMTPLMERKKINLTWEREATRLEETLFIDPERIGQVVSNLLSNAIKFVPEKGNIIIKLSRVNSGGYFQELSVIDDGPGVPVETRKHLFEKYVQLKTDYKLKGTGLGLTVSKMIVESHGGHIGFRPGPQGKGSVFFFRLPLPR